MGPDPDYPELREFEIVFEVALTDEQLIEIPYWTKVDHVAKINPAEFVRYDLALGYLDKPKLLPFSTIKEGCRTFDISRNRFNTNRKVTFSPKVDVKPIELIQRNELVEDGEYFTGHSALWDGIQSGPGTHVIDLDEIIQQGHKLGFKGAAKDTEVLNENLEDLVPPDFDIVNMDMDNIFIPSARDGFESDSVSCMSSDED